MAISAKNYAVSLLAGRDYSRKQIRQKLTAKEFESTEIDITLDYCQANGYQSDHRYAQGLLRSHVSKGHGVIRIKQDMVQKGLDADVIQATLDQSDCDWFELAKMKAQKKYANKPIVDYKDKAKRIRFLMGQGFDYEQACFALDTDAEF